MKIKKVNGEEIDLVMKGRHRRRAFNVVKEFNNTKEEEYPQFITKINETLTEIVKDATGLTDEELDDLDIDDINKLVATVKSKCFDNLGFQTP